MIKKIFRSIVLASIVSLLACLVIVSAVLYEYFAAEQKNRLSTELDLASSAVELSGEDYLSAVNTDGYRLTWVSADGRVLFDSQADAATMENHASREEIIEAKTSGTGESVRYSETLTKKTLYCARLLSDGTVLRVSVETAGVLLLVVGMLPALLLVFVVALIVSAILASRMSRRIVDPLNNLDLEHPLNNDAYEELSPLLRRINQLHLQVRSKVGELKKKTDEFEQITSCMSEGLVLLDNKSRIVSINSAAARLFEADEDCIGKDFIGIERSPEINDALTEATENGQSELRIERSGREYQLDVTRIESDGEPLGAVMLIFDVTERVFAERNRREFTANVSHELKTPLQSITGSAELIENGLVKQEDMPRFVSHIRTEATRLVSLIDDIIRLSQLDEAPQLEKREVDLYDLALETVRQLEPAAQAKGITLRVSGEHSAVMGSASLLGEVVYNLCDNAIKYNKPGGEVEIAVSGDPYNAVFSVSDTGIGIPPEHRDRVFERFYRVDKSHSKESGGTGLGLSIVKHAVQYHQGKIALDSIVGKGSRFTVTLPRE